MNRVIGCESERLFTEQVDDAVVVAGVQLDQISEEQQKAGVYHRVVQLWWMHLWTQT